MQGRYNFSKSRQASNFSYSKSNVFWTSGFWQVTSRQAIFTDLFLSTNKLLDEKFSAKMSFLRCLFLQALESWL
jgi:hypothetical protein